MTEPREKGTGWPGGIDLALPNAHAENRFGDIWRQLREGPPMAWHPAGESGFWVASRHRLVSEVLRDAERFTSRQGNVLATLLTGGDSASDRMLAVMDGPRHQLLRREMAGALTRSALTDLTARTGRAVRRSIAEAVQRESCDFAADVAEAIPLAAICDLLGVPENDRPEVYGYATAALAADLPDAGELEARLARNQILLYFGRLMERRSAAPQSDMLGLLLDLARGPSALTEDEILFNCYSLLVGGDETTRLTIIGSVKALAEWPDQWHRLCRGEVSVESAVEELLRWTTPALHAGRTATRKTVLGGHEIAAGDTVTVWMASANFDPAEFDHPDELDLARRPNRHLSFSYGAHFCLGAHLARIELAAVLSALVEQVEQIEVVGEPEPIYSSFLSGFRRLPVRLTPRTRSTPQRR